MSLLLVFPAEVRARLDRLARQMSDELGCHVPTCAVVRALAIQGLRGAEKRRARFVQQVRPAILKPGRKPPPVVRR